jgi:hypothetical protein
MHKPQNQKKLREIANKHGISLATANEIIGCQWEFVKLMMNTIKPLDQDYPVINVIHLGKFLITKKRKFMLNKFRSNKT